MTGPAAIRELQVFCDLPAEAAIREAATFFAERGLVITRQDAHSLGLLGPTAAAAPPAQSQPRQASRPAAPPSARQQPPWRPASWAPLMQRDNRGTARDAGAVAAVTAQVDPGKCRVWLTVEGQGAVAAAAAALVAHWRPRSAAAAAAVTAKERHVFTEGGWAEREAAVRANWRRSGVPPAEVEQRLEKLRHRWAHIANKTEPEDE